MRHSRQLWFNAFRLCTGIALGLALLLITAPAMAQVFVYNCEILDELYDNPNALIYRVEHIWYAKNCVKEAGKASTPASRPPAAPTPTPTPVPPVDSCSELPASVSVRGFHSFSTQCRQVSGAGVGNAELTAQGIIGAVDVWGDANREMQVCFQQPGRLVFLDAAMSPRAVSDLPAVRTEGMTCGPINRAGTVVLVPGEAPPAPAEQPAVEEPAAAPAIVVPPGEAPYICQLIAGDILNFRASTGLDAEVLMEIPTFTLLVPVNRTRDWFQVAFEGQLGWVHKDYVFQSVGCNAFNAVGNAPMPLASQAQSPGSESDASAAQPESAPRDGSSQSCSLRALDILNLRTGPGLEHEILAEIPYQSMLSGSDRTSSWFYVEHDGLMGWVHSDYVLQTGDCG